MRSRLLMVLSLTFFNLTACDTGTGPIGGTGNNTGNTAQLTLGNTGDKDTFRITDTAVVTVTQTGTNQISVEVENLNQQDQLNISIFDAVSGLLLFEQKFVLPGAKTQPAVLPVSQSTQLHFEALNVGTATTAPVNCNATDPASCLSKGDVSIILD